MGLRGYPMNTGNVIVFAISLGVAVDDTIHFLARFREELVQHPTVSRAIEQNVPRRGSGNRPDNAIDHFWTSDPAHFGIRTHTAVR